MSEMRLADDFPVATEAEWRALVDKVLKGADFDRRLTSRTADGIRIAPLYTRKDRPAAAAHAPAVSRAAGEATGWEARQLHADGDPAAANAAILEDLAGGVSSITLRIAAPGQFGLPYDNGSLPRALEGVLLDACPIALEAGEYTTDAAGALIETWRAAGIPEVKWQGAFNYDPLGNLARTGALYHPIDRALGIAAEFLKAHRHPGVTALVADGRPYHEAGASEGQELAAMLATLVAYLRAAERAGVAPTDAMPQIAVALAADADQLMTIAKLRAARRMIARVAEASGAAAAVPRVSIAATTSERMMAKRDPWVNMLRTTMACAAAAMGGADSITVLPFTWALGKPDAFARRIARNTHNVLREESGLDRVSDPAAGSFAIEHLTDDLAQKAWALFQEIEMKGGMPDSLTSGFISGQISATADARAKLIATARLELTGSSAFPKLGDDGVQVAAHDLPLPATLNGARMTPLAPCRLAAPFEALRDRADAFEKRTGKPPQMFLASLGALAEHSVRTTWIANFLAAGGIRAIISDGFANSTDAGKAFADSSARIACLCSSDRVYGELAEATALLLKTAGATRVYLAGRPNEQELQLKATGVDDFIFAGTDAIAMLTKLQRELGV